MVEAGGVPVMTGHYDYIRDPKAIYAESFAQVRAAVDLSRFPSALHPMVERLVHACARPEIADQLRWEGVLAEAGCAALRAGAPILADAEMVARGVTRSLLPADNAVLCRLNEASVPGHAKQLGTTRSAAAVELWRDDLDGAVVAIGNAPTALFHLLERLREGWPRPAVILAFPVGFVGASESKQALMEAGLGIPFITLPGRDGGSALAAAAVNGLSVSSAGGGAE
ncbi:precorrin-8X methylmutase [Hwanghaeella sp.]|uniref:precorrin-8X methylmutase n=1 Tax=Hwanghaeella sp. TaxID=2605943 RepID=UPI003CCB7C11